MTVQAFLILNAAQKAATEALNPTSVGKVWCRPINNPLSDNLGEGVLLGLFVLPARLLNDPDYTAFYATCGALPIRTLDSEVLFLPDQPL